ncbi:MULTISPECIES: MobF family relaxase [Sphingobium]|uniref:IncW plasmid conjugative relaxase protein TrwC n=1 Tax=Sphingobium fuliginis (strain ATCC 27551) TaxID=336203 RepID=A0A292ZJ04_SPHSA|nr:MULTISPECIES: MobF family relaxase [Sphingobium]OAP29817.1 AAA family ATPase [Sphingobium sp. 20006FA]KXU30182.1 AAA family ATPase [Sphingobium sp. AM]KYC30268.1 AAA family ATPase [Sphingobium sp. 22B]MCB4861885.1 conjugative relaxase [Sphingobium sp. PNB]MEC6701247.1 MobF family relaxase [Sphingobium sp. SJ10-10]
MLSIASVRSASGAANYFAQDNYYTVEGSSELSLWEGEGARDLGLAGEVGKDAFEAILKGELPSGEQVGQVENRRAGYDLTFSMPKSASVMAYVAGDRRILAANMSAVKATMAWVEKNLAEGRKDQEGRKVPIPTGNLVYALFEHDTSRALDPQGHIHAVIANLTKMLDGKWQALHADRIWSNNSVIGAIYHAYLRGEIEKLGYGVDLKGKHGTFEITGVPQPVIDAYSQRRQDILEKATELGLKSPEALREITTRTRDPKLNVEDRAALLQGWKDKGEGLGFTGQELREAAILRSAGHEAAGRLETGYRAIRDAVAGAWHAVGAVLSHDDPLVDRRIARIVQSPAAGRAQLAVASAVRIHGEREAAFEQHKLAKTALDLGLKGVTIEHVERRIGQLVDKGLLLRGVERAAPMLTTREALATEENILALVEASKGQAAPMLDPAEAPQRLQQASSHPLNPGQLGSATLIVSSSDRTISIQGVAGAGKSTMLSAVARVAEGEGRKILGLAVQNKMVADMKEGAGIEAQTIASFVLAHERFVARREGPAYEVARERMEGAMLVVDETSMVSSRDMLSLHQIVAALGIEQLVLVGDRQQLSSIDAGKAFAMIQAGGGTMARMDQNIRQRTDELRAVAALANLGKASQAMKVLGDKVVESAAPADEAADRWLSLSPQERAATAVFASGRETRQAINECIQAGLSAEGTLKGEGIHLTIFERVNMTREELRYAANYRAGQVLEVGRGGANDVGLKAGRYDVLKVHANGRVDLTDGRRKIRFDPARLSPTEQRDRLQLSEKKGLHLREGDTIRWTAKDKPRELWNAAIARVVRVDATGVTVNLGQDKQLTLAVGDPMLSRLDLAYSLNMHMAQGITTDKAITVMASHERNLSNQRLFNVGVTRVRDELTMIVDDKEKLARQLDHNPGNKTSALETLGRLAIDGPQARGPAKFDPGPVEGVTTGAGSHPADFPADLPPLPDNCGKPVDPRDGHGPPAQGQDRADLLPPLPERGLGLDL